MDLKTKEIVKILKNDGVGVMPTDTIYGLVGSALSKKAVKRVHKIKNRSKNKKLIVLISSISDLKKFGINLNNAQKYILKKYWPGKISIVLPCFSPKFKYLHMGTKCFSCRMPHKKSLINILKKTGPLVAPSANPEGLEPAKNIKEAQKYFGNKIDFYLSNGTLRSKPSALIEIDKDGGITIVRGTIKK